MCKWVLLQFGQAFKLQSSNSWFFPMQEVPFKQVLILLRLPLPQEVLQPDHVPQELQIAAV